MSAPELVKFTARGLTAWAPALGPATREAMARRYQEARFADLPRVVDKVLTMSLLWSWHWWTLLLFLTIRTKLTPIEREAIACQLMGTPLRPRPMPAAMPPLPGSGGGRVLM